MKLCGVSGYARAGKDTFTEILVEDYGFTRLAFADLVRGAIYMLNPIVDPIVGFRVSDFVDDYGWDYAKENVPEVRHLMQRMGTEVGRELLGEDLWVNAAFAMMESSKDYCLSDMRFPNEATRIVENGGVTVRINRDGIVPANNHPGETALDQWDFDYVIDNNSNVDYLREIADSIVTEKGWR